MTVINNNNINIFRKQIKILEKIKDTDLVKYKISMSELNLSFEQLTQLL
jgi:hypothetical protein